MDQSLIHSLKFETSIIHVISDATNITKSKNIGKCILDRVNTLYISNQITSGQLSGHKWVKALVKENLQS